MWFTAFFSSGSFGRNAISISEKRSFASVLKLVVIRAIPSLPCAVHPCQSHRPEALLHICALQTLRSLFCVTILNPSLIYNAM